MNSLEFTTKIEHGVIHLPKEFEDCLKILAFFAKPLRPLRLRENF